MSPADVFPYFIKEIYQVSSHKHVVQAFLKVDTPTDVIDEEYFFLAKDWEEINKQKWFLETQPINKGLVQYYESLSDNDFYSMIYSKKLTQFSDEEFIDEFNRRLNSPFHKIEFVGKAQIKKG